MLAPQVPTASGSRHAAPHGQMRAPEQVPPAPQSESRQHWPLIVGRTLQTPVHDEAVPTQYAPGIGLAPMLPTQSASCEQQPRAGVHAVRHSPVYETLTPAVCAMHAFE